MAASVNAELTLLYWRIGRRIQTEVLNGERAVYGKQVQAGLSKTLTQEYGRGWSEKTLRHCLHAVETIPEEIFSTVCRQLSWSHLKLLIYLDDDLKRSFYLEMAAMERWSVRQLSERIQSMLYERTALSRKPEETIAHDLAQLRGQKLSPDLVLKDPYLLDFLGLNDRYLEKDLEDAILRELEQFLLELGAALLLSPDKSGCRSTTMISTSTCYSTTASSSGWWLWTSNWGTFGPNTRARWSCICAGWPATSKSRARNRRWASSCAPARSKSRSNCSSWTRAASTWPSI